MIIPLQWSKAAAFLAAIVRRDCMEAFRLYSHSQSEDFSPYQHPTLGNLVVRPFDGLRDQESLEDLCKNVFRGTDYLPKVSERYEADPHCKFLVMVGSATTLSNTTTAGIPTHNQRGRDAPLLAVGNIRRIDEDVWWLEAVRTRESCMNQGLAQSIINHLLLAVQQEATMMMAAGRCAAVSEADESTVPPELPSSSSSSSSKKKIMSCTVESNKSMQRVLNKVGMRQVSSLHLPNLRAMAKLPGWRKRNKKQIPSHLLGVLCLDDQVSRKARSSVWKEVTTVSQLQTLLEQIKKEGGCGHIPGMYELLSMQKIMECMEQGLLFHLDEIGQEEEDNVESNLSGRAEGMAVAGFIQEGRNSLFKSPWILCLAGTTDLHLEAALWMGCTHKIQSCLAATIVGGKQDAATPFLFSLDGSIALDGPIASKLPLVEDQCLVYQMLIEPGLTSFEATPNEG